MSFDRAMFRGSLIAASFLFAFAPLSSRATAAPTHVSDAESLLTNLTASRQNVYGSSPSYIYWTGTTSKARTVCGTFITNLLMHSYKWTSSTFSSWMGTTSPSATVWHDAIVSQNQFTHITDITQVQPGDIIAIKYPSGSGVTGHAMMVDSVPKAMSGNGQYAVTVIDSSSGHHGSQDTRVTHPSTTGNGVGKGDIRIYVDSAHKPIGYSWSNESGSPEISTSSRPLAIGRLTLAHFSYAAVPATPPMAGGSGQSGASAQPDDYTEVIESNAMALSDDDSMLAFDATGAPMISDTGDVGAQATGCSIGGHVPAATASPAAMLGLALFLGWLGLRRRRVRPASC